MEKQKQNITYKLVYNVAIAYLWLLYRYPQSESGPFQPINLLCCVHTEMWLDIVYEVVSSHYQCGILRRHSAFTLKQAI